MEPLLKDTSDIRTPCLIRTLEWVPTLYKYILFSTWKMDIHLTDQDNYLGPKGVSIREVPLYSNHFVHCIYIFKLVVIFRRTFASVDIFWPSPAHQQWQRLCWHLKWAWTGVINFTCPKCIKLPTFVYDRLTIRDLIHFSGTDSSRELVLDRCRLLSHVLLTLY